MWNFGYSGEIIIVYVIWYLLYLLDVECICICFWYLINNDSVEVWNEFLNDMYILNIFIYMYIIYWYKL